MIVVNIPAINVKTAEIPSIFALEHSLNCCNLLIFSTGGRAPVTTRGNRSTLRKPVVLGELKLDNTLLTGDQGNFNQITAWRCSRTLAVTQTGGGKGSGICFIQNIGRINVTTSYLYLQKS